MFNRRVQLPRLHATLSQGHVKEFSGALKISTNDKSSRDKFDRTPMQIAAKKGHVSAILQLLYEEVDPNVPRDLSPLFLALTYSQELAASVLYYAGARALSKKNAHLLAQMGLADDFKPEKKVFVPMLIWLVSQEDERKIMQLLTKMIELIDFDDKEEYKTALLPRGTKIDYSEIESDLRAIFTRAVEKNHRAVSNYLVKKFPGIIRPNPECVSAGYWAAVHKNTDILEEVKKDPAHFVQALQELKQQNQDALFAQHVPDLLLSSYTQLHEEKEQKSSVSKKILEIYFAANYSRGDTLAAYSKIFQKDFIKACQYAVKVKNYQALTHFFSEKNIFNKELMIDLNDKDFLFFYMFLTSQFSYELSQLFINQLNDLWRHLPDKEQEGVLNCYLLSALDSAIETREPKEVSIQKKYFIKMAINQEIWLKQYLKIIHHQDALPVEEDKESRKLYQKTMNDALRFGYKLELGDAKISHHPIFSNPDLGSVVASFLDDDDYMALRCTSHKMDEMLQQGHILERELQTSIQLLLEALEGELDSQWFFRGKKKVMTVLLVILISAIILMVSTYGAEETESQIDAIFEQMKLLNYTLGSCYDFSNGNTGCKKGYVVPPCDTLCNDLNDPNSYQAVSYIVMGLSSLVIVGATCGIALLKELRNQLCSGKERFDDDKLDTFSHPLQQQADALYANLRDHRYDVPLTTASTVKDTRHAFRTGLVFFNRVVPEAGDAKTGPEITVFVDKDKSTYRSRGPSPTR